MDLNPATIEYLKELMDAARDRCASEVSYEGFSVKFFPDIPKLLGPRVVDTDVVPLAMGPVAGEQPALTKQQAYSSLFGGKAPSFAVRTDVKVP